jgi:hypothetical protein
MDLIAAPWHSCGTAAADSWRSWLTDFLIGMQMWSDAIDGGDWLSGDTIGRRGNLGSRDVRRIMRRTRSAPGLGVGAALSHASSFAATAPGPVADFIGSRRGLRMSFVRLFVGLDGWVDENYTKYCGPLQLQEATAIMNKYCGKMHPNGWQIIQNGWRIVELDEFTDYDLEPTVFV